MGFDGKNVATTRFAVGDEVFGMSRGSFAEYAAAREDKLAHKPASCKFEQAAVVGISGGTRHRRDHDPTIRRHQATSKNRERQHGRPTKCVAE
jgi:NADPH:quinone reductase-like Zn-dependent oxidoreductase